MMKRALMILAALASLVPCAAPARADEPPKKTVDLVVHAASGKDQTIHAELALTPEEHRDGLMYRTDLPADGGMLFVFAEEGERAFWMKNTYIPLDMLFIRADGTIDSIHENAKPQNLTPIPSYGPVLDVLELNGGAASKFGIKQGDVISNPDYFKKPGKAQ
jgi:uncharacterized membrane protein (UPF0127 family)